MGKSGRKRALYAALVLALACCRTETVSFRAEGAPNLEKERAFAESLWAALDAGERPEERGEGGPAERAAREAKAPESPDIVAVLSEAWERAGEEKEGMVLSRVWFVPRADPLDGRVETTLAACLGGEEELVPLADLRPPYTAPRVDGLSAADAGYPLVRVVRALARVPGEKNLTKRKNALVREKIELFREALRENALIEKAPAIFWIASGGDLMLDRGASGILFGEGPAKVFGQTAEMLKSADLSLVNLEGVVSDRGVKTPKSFNFRFVPQVAAALREAGVGAVLHANNHVYDYGPEAFLDSLSWLEKAGLGIAGAGRNIEAASEPFVYRRGEVVCRVFGIASFPRERNGWDGVSAAAGPQTAGMLHSGKEGGEMLKSKLGGGGESLNVVLFHGGVEWSTSPDAETRALYTELVRAGADLVIGSHPHIVQGFEWVEEKPVFWSLGNYVFGGAENTEGGEEGLFVRLGFLNKRLVYLEPFALTLTHTGTDIAPAENLKSFYRRSRELRRPGVK